MRYVPQRGNLRLDVTARQLPEGTGTRNPQTMTRLYFAGAPVYNVYLTKGG